MRRRVEQMQNQLAALTGVTPPARSTQPDLPPGTTPEMAEAIERARQEFAMVFPHLAKLNPEQIDKLLGFLETGMPQIEEVTSHTWRSLGMQMKRAIDTEVKEHIGALSARGMQRVYGAFHHLLSTDEDAFARYQAGDPSLVTDFINDYKQDVLDPYHTGRTTAAASGVVRGRNLPRGGASSAVVPAGRSGEPALDPNDEDAVHKRAFQRMRARANANQPSA